jgi:hypothetical protein
VVVLADGSVQVTAAAGAVQWTVNGSTGALSAEGPAGAVLQGGPAVMVLPLDSSGGNQLVEGGPPILPLTEPLSGWVASGQPMHVVGVDYVRVNVSGTYAGQASATFSFTFAANNTASVAYEAVWAAAAGKVTPRQVGVVFSVPAALDTLAWQRVSQFSYYPDDAVGRPVGAGVKANVCATPRPAAQAPTTPWSGDCSPLGTNDFRATKHNFTSFALSDGTASSFSSSSSASSFSSPSSSSRVARLVEVRSSGATQHGRAWFDTDSNAFKLLVADYSNEGGNTFENTRVVPSLTVSAGDSLTGTVVLAVGL